MTIKKNEPLEISSLDRDIRFCDKGLKYYLGIPLQLKSGENIGALCVFDEEDKAVSEIAIGQLKIIANEIVSKLELMKDMQNLEFALTEAEKDKNRWYC